METTTFIPPLFQPSSTFLAFVLDNVFAVFAAVALIVVLGLLTTGLWLYERRVSRLAQSGAGSSDSAGDTPSGDLDPGQDGPHRHVLGSHKTSVVR